MSERASKPLPAANDDSEERVIGTCAIALKALGCTGTPEEIKQQAKRAIEQGREQQKEFEQFNRELREYCEWVVQFDPDPERRACARLILQERQEPTEH
jgi:hypothetical protein